MKQSIKFLLSGLVAGGLIYYFLGNQIENYAANPTGGSSPVAQLHPTTTPLPAPYVSTSSGGQIITLPQPAASPPVLYTPVTPVTTVSVAGKNLNPATITTPSNPTLYTYQPTPTVTPATPTIFQRIVAAIAPQPTAQLPPISPPQNQPANCCCGQSWTLAQGCHCEAGQSIVNGSCGCPQGTTWDGSSCISNSTTCMPGMRLVDGMCECIASNTFFQGSVQSGHLTGSCVPQTSQNCPPFMDYNDITGQCSAPWGCPDGYYDPGVGCLQPASRASPTIVQPSTPTITTPTVPSNILSQIHTSLQQTIQRIVFTR